MQLTAILLLLALGTLALTKVLWVRQLQAGLHEVRTIVKHKRTTSLL